MSLPLPWTVAGCAPEGVHAMVVPGSGLVEKQAEEEGLERRHWSVAVRHLNI